jgi:hypothetical protein
MSYHIWKIPIDKARATFDRKCPDCCEQMLVAERDKMAEVWKDSLGHVHADEGYIPELD